MTLRGVWRRAAVVSSAVCRWISSKRSDAVPEPCGTVEDQGSPRPTFRTVLPPPVLIVGADAEARQTRALQIHEATRSGGPFESIAVDQLPVQLVKCVIFGLESWKRSPSARLLCAAGGSILLDGAQDLDAEGRELLTRFIATGELTPVGASAHAVQTSDAAVLLGVPTEDALPAELLQRWSVRVDRVE